MKQSDVLTWLYDKIVTSLTESPLVTLDDESQHVGLARGRDEHPYPFVGLDYTSGDPRSAGIGAGTAFVEELQFDQNDVLDAIVYRRDTVLTVTMQVLTDGDRQLRDDLAETLQGRFAVIARKDTFPTDMSRLDVGTATPTSRPDTFVYGDGTDLTIEYSTFTTDDDPDAAEEVNLTVTTAEDSTGSNGSQSDYTITP